MTTKPDLAQRALERRRRQDFAGLLPILGGFLLLSPIIWVFAQAGTILGLPAVFVYVFGVWLGLILLARRLARAIMRDDPG
ncbi:MAG: hypothetical protein WD046_12360 [Paracoccaceae bacterium]